MRIKRGRSGPDYIYIGKGMMIFRNLENLYVRWYGKYIPSHIVKLLSIKDLV